MPLKSVLLTLLLFALGTADASGGEEHKHIGNGAKFKLIVEQRPSHHTANGFRNPYSLVPQNRRRRPLGWRRMRKGYAQLRERDRIVRSQAHLVPRQEADLEAIQNPSPDTPQITWIGHSTVLIQYQGVNVITDPIFSDYCGPGSVSWLSLKRITPPAVAMEDLPPIDYVVISHNHYDHLDLATVRHLGDGPLWLVPLGVGDWLKRVGINKTRAVQLDWWDEHRSQDGVTITSTPAQHWSRRGLRDYNRTLWSSWHIKIGDFSAWFGGDTGYNDHQFVEIGERMHAVDVAFIPIGAYKPRDFMRTSHIDPHEAVRVFQDIKARSAIGIHWGTFSLSSEGLLDPIADLQLAVGEAELPATVFEAPVLGRTFAVKLGDESP